MIFNRARFEQLSEPMKSVVLALLPAPLFVVFAIGGDLPRGTLVWTFSSALLIAVNAQAENKSYKKLMPPSAALLVLHVPLVIWNPLRQSRFFGGIVTPITVADVCIDYAFLWLSQKIFDRDQIRPE